MVLEDPIQLSFNETIDTMVRNAGARTRTKRTKGGGNGQKKQQMVVARNVRSNFDKAARDYIALLLDPCNGPLVHGLYPGVGAGMIFRAEYSIPLNLGATSAAGFVHFTPGGNGTSSVCVYAMEAPGDTSPLIPTGTGYIPAYTFLTGNAAAVRPLAACAQVMYLGSESTRSGLVGVGQTAGSSIGLGASTNVGNILGCLSNMERMPVNALEVVWRPGEGDGDFADISGPATSEGKNAITVAWTGAPLGTQIRVRLVVVWEMKFKLLNTGLVDGFDSVNQSRNTLQEIFTYLADKGHLWVRSVGRTAGAAMAAGAADYVRAVTYGHVRRPTQLLN